MQTNIFQKDHKEYIEVVRERVQMYGKSNATIPELLALVIGNSANTNICGQLSALSVRDLLAMTAKDFMTLGNITKSVAERLEAAVTLSKLVSEQSLPECTTIRSPEDAAHLFDYLRHEEQENLVVAFLNVKNEVIGREAIFKGSLQSSIVHPREIFRKAMERSSASVIIAHNHPSGSTDPSPDDIEVTKRLVECGNILGIEVLDHVIIGDGKFLSLKEKGYM